MDRNLEKQLYNGKRTINDLSHPYSYEGMTSKMIHLSDIRQAKRKESFEIMSKHKPYANDIGILKEQFKNENALSE